jgi:hypothetical protein
MWKSLIITIIFAASAYAQDTVWIESPRLVNLRQSSEKTLTACVEVGHALHSALHRISETAPKENISDITSLDTIIVNQEAEINFTNEIKNEYIKTLHDYFDALKTQYDEARESLKLCDYLESKRQFYIRDQPITYYYNKLSQSQIDSLYEIYIQQNSPHGDGMYYFDDWLWLKLHNQLPGDEDTPKKKDRRSAQAG